MQSSDTPSRMPIPFANNGIKNEIPTDPSPVAGLASLYSGFPPETMTPVTTGGIPPSGADFNGILNAISQNVRWTQAGGTYSYDLDFATAIGGYPRGAVLKGGSAGVIWVSLVDSNLTNPDSTDAQGWYASSTYGKRVAEVIARVQGGGTASIACEGDSNTYCQQTDGPGAPINGSGERRSAQPWPENLVEALNLMTGGGFTVTNRGYPGDSTIEGLERWAAAPATDIAFLMYGTNDANNYGLHPHGPVPVAEFRSNLAKIIVRHLSRAAAVVVLAPPQVQDPIQADKIRPYALAAQDVANEYGCMFVDVAEILNSITDYYTDGIHLTSFAYAEIGWQLPSLFYKWNGAMIRVSAGDFYYPDDQLGAGVGECVGTLVGAKGANRLIQIDPGQVYLIGVECDDDVLPVIHSYNLGGVRQISAYYAGGESATRGIPTARLLHDAAYGIRQSLTCSVLKKGKRTVVLRNNDPTYQAYIEAIQFVDRTHLHTALGREQKSSALSGAFQPQRSSAALAANWTAVDYSCRLEAPYAVTANLKLSGNQENGVAIWKQVPDGGELPCGNALMIIRSGSTLTIRDFVNATPTNQSFPTIFPASGDWSGEIHVDVQATAVNVYVNGTLAGSMESPVNTLGYPGFISNKAAFLECKGFYYQGAVKGPY